MAATLNDIRIKVRRLTRTPSTSQLDDIQLDDYINSFYRFDLTENLRLFNDQTLITWYTSPNIDVYPTDTSIDPLSPLYDFQNNYVTTDQPMYIAGYEAVFTQSRTQFFRLFPIIDAMQNVGVGNGANVGFNGTLTNTPIQKNNVTFSSIDSNNFPIVITDVPVTINNFAGNLVDTDGTIVGSIDYLTGVWNIDFQIAPGNNQNITAMYYPYVANRPNTILYYDDKFTVRPIPDKPYPISMQVYKIPALLVEPTDMPELNQWWEYIAYGAAKKIFEDRMDQESLAAIMPEFEKQEMLVQRRTLMQRATQRTATIYSSLDSMGYQWGNNYPGSF